MFLIPFLGIIDLNIAHTRKVGGQQPCDYTIFKGIKSIISALIWYNHRVTARLLPTIRVRGIISVDKFKEFNKPLSID